MAKELAIRGKIPKMARVHTRGYLHYHDKRKRDPGNWYPSYKAVIDGVVDAGVIRDDSDEFLIFDGIHRGMPNIRGNQLVVEIWEG
ncbi:MAG TPA: hypothetical protein VGR89_14460 [Puia sp.]|nr:hypothetical protein [Puia sp.]